MMKKYVVWGGYECRLVDADNGWDYIPAYGSH